MNDQKIRDYLLKIRQLADDCLSDLSQNGANRESSAGGEGVPEIDSDSVSNIDIVNEMNDCDEAKKVREYVLSSGGPAVNRVLLPLYICSKYFDEHKLTNLDIRDILLQFGIKMRSDSIERCLKSNKRYLKLSDLGGTKKYLYTLNNPGKLYFEALLEG